MDFLRVAGAQLNFVVGDIDGNTARIIEAMEWAAECQADVILFPELAITGYPPEDLVLKSAFIRDNISALHRLAARSGETAAVVGFVDRGVGQRDDAGHPRVHNAAALVAGGGLRGVYHKGLLPNYGVFDEDRYFAVGENPASLWEINGVVAGVSVCEDIWVPDGPPADQVNAGAEILLNINGSPYHHGKGNERQRMLAERARSSGVPLVYLNLVGGQDELVFDGQSMVFDSSGEVLYRAAQFEEELFWVDVPLPESKGDAPTAQRVSTGDLLEGEPEPPLATHEPYDKTEEIYRALCLGLGDYVRKNGFSGVVIGLSGGIDSALTAAVATDALGAGAVRGVTMPSRYSSSGSVEDSRVLAANLGIAFDEISVEPPFTGFLEALGGAFELTEVDVAEQNLQARARGAILMALSNKFGGMVVATGNKSEMSVGYATLYGDMVGGYAVLKDVSKTLVYELARWRNRAGEVIPQSTIDKPPSAELKPDQKDTDSLPPYEVLDPILERYVEDDASVKEIVEDGFEEDTVRRIAQMVDRNEYKRRQAAPGVRITTKSLGRDRRLPITNKYSD
ncbi:MAG: NAD+ synthase [Acidimicrobiia bacterium]